MKELLENNLFGSRLTCSHPCQNASNLCLIALMFVDIDTSLEIHGNNLKLIKYF